MGWEGPTGFLHTFELPWSLLLGSSGNQSEDAGHLCRMDTTDTSSKNQTQPRNQQFPGQS